MKAFKIIMSLFLALIISAISSAGLAQFGFDPTAVGLGTFAAALLPKLPNGVLGVGINVEVWHNMIVENLFANNLFINDSFDASEFVLAGKVVHIPNAGQPSAVKRNRTILPAVVKRREDVDVSYMLDEYTTDPRVLTHADHIELSYDKMRSCLAEDMQAIELSYVEYIKYLWAKDVTNIVATNGDAIAAHTTNATGNRKALTKAALTEAQARMDELNVPEVDRFALLDARMYQQLLDSLTERELTNLGAGANLAKGIVGEYAGFKIRKRSTVLVYTTAGVLLAPGATGATTDNAAAICWQKNAVEKAVGTIIEFFNENDPEYYGDTFSLLVNAGGRRRRNGNEGVVIIRQAAA